MLPRVIFAWPPPRFRRFDRILLFWGARKTICLSQYCFPSRLSAGLSHLMHSMAPCMDFCACLPRSGYAPSDFGVRSGALSLGRHRGFMNCRDLLKNGVRKQLVRVGRLQNRFPELFLTFLARLGSASRGSGAVLRQSCGAWGVSGRVLEGVQGLQKCSVSRGVGFGMFLGGFGTVFRVIFHPRHTYKISESTYQNCKHRDVVSSWGALLLQFIPLGLSVHPCRKAEKLSNSLEVI